MKNVKPYWMIVGIIVVAVIAITIFSIQNSTNKIPSECVEYSGDMKSQCIIGIAQEEDDLSLCELLPDRTEENQWTSSPKKGDCFSQIAMVKKDWTICKNIEEANSDKKIGSNDKDGCIKLIADIKRDAIICNNIAQNSVQELCFKSVAFLTADKSLCDSAGSLKEQCVEDVNGLCSSCLQEGMICPDYYKC